MKSCKAFDQRYLVGRPTGQKGRGQFTSKADRARLASQMQGHTPSCADRLLHHLRRLLCALKQRIEQLDWSAVEDVCVGHSNVRQPAVAQFLHCQSDLGIPVRVLMSPEWVTDDNSRPTPLRRDECW